MFRRPRHVATLALGLALVAVAPGAARAYEERLTLELGAGYGMAPRRSEPLPQGPSLLAEALIGLSPAWSIGTRLGYTAFFPSPPAHLVSLGVEAVYQVDVVSVVPRISFGALALLEVAGGRAEGDLAPTCRLGLDFLRDGWLLGLDLRGSVPVLGRIDGLGPVILELGLRVGLVIDRY